MQAGQPVRDERFLAGDSLRGLAALTVCLFHIWGSTRLAYAAKGDAGAFNALGSGEFWVGHLSSGLYVFFVLSGYLIGRPFLATILRDAPAPDLRKYARNRFLRIVPAFWAVWTVILVIWGFHGGSIKDVLGVYAGFQDLVDRRVSDPQFVQGWTIGAELLFYLTLPIAAAGIVWALTRFRLPRWPTVATAITLAFAGGLMIRAANTDGVKYLQFYPAVAFAFVPGLALAAIELRYAKSWRGAAWGKGLAWGLLAATFAIYAGFVAVKPDSVMGITISEIAVAVPLVAAALVLQWTTGRNWAFFSNPVAVWLGSRSYSFYLWHVAVIYALRDVWTQPDSTRTAMAVALPLVLIVTSVMSEITFRLIERPALRLRAGKPHQASEFEAQANRTVAQEARALLTTYQHRDEREREAHLAESERSA